MKLPASSISFDLCSFLCQTVSWRSSNWGNRGRPSSVSWRQESRRGRSLRQSGQVMDGRSSFRSIPLRASPGPKFRVSERLEVLSAVESRLVSKAGQEKEALVMASVKKTMKSSKTKQAKQPETPKAKASQHSTLLKAKRAAAGRALASKKLAANKFSGKTKSKTAVVTRRANSPVAAKPAARKKASAARAAPRASNTIGAAKKGATRSAKPVLARATGGASARANAKAVGKAARRASGNKSARGKPAAAAKRLQLSKFRAALPPNRRRPCARPSSSQLAPPKTWPQARRPRRRFSPSSETLRGFPRHASKWTRRLPAGRPETRRWI